MISVQDKIQIKPIKLRLKTNVVITKANTLPPTVLIQIFRLVHFRHTIVRAQEVQSRVSDQFLNIHTKNIIKFFIQIWTKATRFCRGNSEIYF